MLPKSFLSPMRQHICREHNTVDIPYLADMVIVSPGDYPRDSDL